MIDDDEYNRLCERQPKSLKGRVWLAAYLIRNGSACTRLYDNCFENGDGGLVMAHLMREIRTESPELRDMMQEQGVWSADYDRIPDPGPFKLTEDDRRTGFMLATGGFSRSKERWQERAATGLTDEQLAEALAYEIGEWGGSASPDGLCLTYQRSGLKIWISWEIENTHQTPPVFQGAATIAMARTVYGIRNPADKQLALF
jgi:hypothetical protein